MVTVIFIDIYCTFIKSITVPNQNKKGFRMFELDVLEKTKSVVGNYPEKRRFAFSAD